MVGARCDLQSASRGIRCWGRIPLQPRPLLRSQARSAQPGLGKGLPFGALQAGCSLPRHGSQTPR